MLRRVVLALLVVALAFIALPITPLQAAPLDTALNTAAIDKMMADLMTMYDVPGTALAIVKDGEVLYAQGYGLRNTQTGAAVTPQSLFAIGSVTKSFTALGVMQLVQAGKLELDTPIITYLPDFKLSDAAATKTLTVRHILSHTSGLPRADEWVFNSTITREQVIRDMATINLTTAPGTTWQYNNQNFVLAGYLIEKVTGLSWEDYTRQRILEPLGMKDTNFDLGLTAAPDHARPHSLDILKGQLPIPVMESLGPVGPAGSINASIADMARYAIFQLGDGSAGTVDGKPLLTAESLKAMHTAQVEMPALLGDVFSNTGYGLGWFRMKYGAVELVEHDGAIFGSISKLTLIPAENMGIVLLSNTGNASLLQEAARVQLLDMLLGLKPQREIVSYLNTLANFDPAETKNLRKAVLDYKPTPGEFKPLLGEYVGTLGISLEMRGTELWAKVAAQNFETILLPIGNDQFVSNTSPIVGTIFTIKTDAQGTITIFQRIGKQDVEIAERLGAGVEVQTVKEPVKERFSVQVPRGLVAQNFGQTVIVSQTEPNGTILIAASDAMDDVQSAIKAWVQQFDPTFNLAPSVTSTFTAPDGTVWEEFDYALPSEQVFVVRALAKDGVLYLAAYQMKIADRAAVEKTVDALMASFTILK
jgi:CubicO group peptidase (beta-lactamase class C family)